MGLYDKLKKYGYCKHFSSFHWRCKSAILEVNRQQQASVTAINDLAALAKTEEVTSNLQIHNIIPSTIKVQAHVLSSKQFLGHLSHSGDIMQKV